VRGLGFAELPFHGGWFGPPDLNLMG